MEAEKNGAASPRLVQYPQPRTTPMAVCDASAYAIGGMAQIVMSRHQ
jgi:hypothetical protein